MLFSQPAVNPLVKKQLQGMIETNTLPPVLLFHGPAQKTAEELALYLIDAKVAIDKHPDIHQILPDKNGLHSIESIRAFIAETTLPPYAAKGKVFIIHQADKMLPTSSNALLKTLEEPPSHTWVILLATDVSAILPTILSRCCVMAFRQGQVFEAHPKTELLLEILQTSPQAGPQTGHWLPLFQKLEESLKETEKEEMKDNKDDALLIALLSWMRDLSLLQLGGDPSMLCFPEHRAALEKEARARSPISLPKIYALIERAHTRLASNIRLAAVLEECLLFLNAER